MTRKDCSHLLSSSFMLPFACSSGLLASMKPRSYLAVALAGLKQSFVSPAAAFRREMCGLVSTVTTGAAYGLGECQSCHNPTCDTR